MLERMMTMTTLGAAALALLCAGCDEEFSTSALTNEGTACLVAPAADPPPGEVAADEMAHVHVVMDGCASGCTVVDEASCTATLDGSVLRVESQARLRIRQGDQCSFECVAVEATCPTPPLPAGTYTVQHGDATRAVTVPGTDACPGPG